VVKVAMRKNCANNFHFQLIGFFEKSHHIPANIDCHSLHRNATGELI
jgi:hypothetical protein